jgi:hypothetical protein
VKVDLIRGGGGGRGGGVRISDNRRQGWIKGKERQRCRLQEFTSFEQVWR